MINGLDRLERLFAYKRRASPEPSAQVSNVVQLSEPQFPSPSFIRPKTIRMAARDDVRLKQAARRSPLVPDISPIQRTAAHAQVSNQVDLRAKLLPLQSPSLSNHRVEHLVTGLHDFQFPKPSSQDDAASVSTALKNSYPLDIPRLPRPRCRSPLEIRIPTDRLDTPPSSDPDNGLFLSTPPAKVLPEVPRRAPPRLMKHPTLALFLTHTSPSLIRWTTGENQIQTQRPYCAIRAPPSTSCLFTGPSASPAPRRPPSCPYAVRLCGSPTLTSSST